METENTLPYNGLIISRTRSDAILSLLMLTAKALKEHGDCPSRQRGHQPRTKFSRPCKARELINPAAVSPTLRARVVGDANASPGWRQQ